MSERHREPHVVNVDESRRVSYLKPRSRISTSWDRLLYNVRYVSRHWKDRFIVKAAAVVVVYTVGFVSYFIGAREFRFFSSVVLHLLVLFLCICFEKFIFPVVNSFFLV